MQRKVLFVEHSSSRPGAASLSSFPELFQVETTRDTTTAVARAVAGRFDLIVLDLDDFGESGAEVCRELRERDGGMPIMLLSTARGPADRLRGYACGASDSMTKPFNIRELVTRLQALLRNATLRKVRSLKSIILPHLSIDFLVGTVVKDGASSSLTARERDLLRYLVARRRRVVSRQELLTEVWGALSSNTRTIDMHVAAVRRKIEDLPGRPRYIITERGNGYRFCG